MGPGALVGHWERRPVTGREGVSSKKMTGVRGWAWRGETRGRGRGDHLAGREGGGGAVHLGPFGADVRGGLTFCAPAAMLPEEMFTS